MDNAIQRIIGVCAVIVAILLIAFYGKEIVLSHQYKIGLVYVPSRAFHEQAAGPIEALVKQDWRFKFVKFAAASTTDQILLSSVCNRALESDADLLICIGQASAQLLAKLSRKREILKPILFLGIGNPMELGVVDSIDCPGHNATGIFHEVSMSLVNPIDLLRLAKPQTSRVLLPYAINERSNEPYVASLKQQADTNSFTIFPFGIDNVGATLVRLADQLTSCDTLMYLEGDAIGSYGPGMGKLASRHGITMFASSPDGVSDAALSYSPDPRHYASYIFDLAKRILVNKEDPAVIPAQLVEGCRDFTINTQLCAEQGLGAIDIENIVHIINTAPEFEPVRGHVVVR